MPFQSITLAMENHLAGVTLQRDEGWINEDDLRQKLARYNPSSGFLEVATQMVREADDWYSNVEVGEGPEQEVIENVSDARRQELAERIWTEMAIRTRAKDEGVASIAQLSLTDLEALADLADRMASPPAPADDNPGHDQPLGEDHHGGDNQMVINQRDSTEDAQLRGSNAEAGADDAR